MPVFWVFPKCSGSPAFPVVRSSVGLMPGFSPTLKAEPGRCSMCPPYWRCWSRCPPATRRENGTVTKNENTRPAGGTAERATETAAFSGAAISCNHSNTVTTGRQIKIAAFLNHGQENAIPRRELEKLTGMDGRTVRLMIEQVNN